MSSSMTKVTMDHSIDGQNSLYHKQFPVPYEHMEKMHCLTILCILLWLIGVFFTIIYVSNKQLSNDTREQMIHFPYEKNNLQTTNYVSTKNDKIKRNNITLKSSGNEVYVHIDGVPVYGHNQTNPKGRGIHVVVINPYTLSVMNSHIFDTMVGKNEVHLAEYLNRVRNGLITIFMVKDEGSSKLGEVGKQAIKAFGGKLIEKLSWRNTWLFVAKKGYKVLGEDLKKSSYINIHGDPIFMRLSIRKDSSETACNWGKSTLERKRFQFCFTYIGYSSLCDCKNPSPINFQSPILLQNNVEFLPITVIASQRPHYLYRMLTTLLATPGVNRDMVTVYVDGYYDETVAIADLLQVRYVEHTSQCTKRKVCRLNQHYRFSLHDTFEKYPFANYMIILEEDLEVSPDIMDYFSQLLPVLETDKSIYCVSAWNDNSYSHSANDPAMLYRVEGMPGLGWILKRDLFKNELEPIWPDIDYHGDWDIFLRQPQNRKGRDCIIPDISRTFHFGKIGVHMNTYVHNTGQFETILNQETGVKFDVSKITKDGYDNEIKRLIKEGETLDHKKNPCQHDNFIPNTTRHVYILYIKWIHDPGGKETWLNVAKCFNLWNSDVRGFYKVSTRFWLNQNHIIVIGSSSPFFRFKPKNITPIAITNWEINIRSKYYT